MPITQRFHKSNCSNAFGLVAEVLISRAHSSLASDDGRRAGYSSASAISSLTSVTEM